MAEFKFTPTFDLGEDRTTYRLLRTEGVSVLEVGGRRILRVDPDCLRELARQAFTDSAFFLRASHLDQLAAIVTDGGATENDRYVARNLLHNAIYSADGILPMCQDTGTAIIVARKGELVWTSADDREHLSHGVYDAFTRENLRYSQMAPLSMFEEVNTGDNLPAQIDIYASEGDEYRFLFIAKGGGSANKTFFYQETKSLLNVESLTAFLKDKLPTLGTAACPPYHLAVAVGGTSAEANLKAVKLASARYYDSLPVSGSPGGRAYRDLEWEEKVLEIAKNTGIGAQFGGSHFCHDVRVIRMPRHAASNPVSIAVSCSADRNIKGKITKDGVFLEQLDRNPGRYGELVTGAASTPVGINLDRPMAEVLHQLSGYPVGTLLHLSGTLVVARDIAHARISSNLKKGQPMPSYFKDHPVYYAGPAKTPQGMVSGSFGPTTAGRMDVYVDRFQSLGGSMIMIAKGNRSKQVSEACRLHGGFYLGSVGGAGASLAKDCITDIKVVDFEDLGMEAVRMIRVKDFPAFIICDDKGNDLFARIV
ncbi:MAG: FumA C-terminus/TtdB family hydratase beta subunit [Proteobacteria bacterium]|nr:FumA C-terminus/TtdB family hydratase beta subunit [Pseudomonadota bacterium]MBU1736644.1 FumA C-terminus/TtdB family hydratase beta subunit [Pseudomonadota bacterium]